MGVPQNAWSIVENHGKPIYTWMTRATPMTKQKPPYFSSGSIPQDRDASGDRWRWPRRFGGTDEGVVSPA